MSSPFSFFKSNWKVKNLSGFPVGTLCPANAFLTFNEKKILSLMLYDLANLDGVNNKFSIDIVVTVSNFGIPEPRKIMQMT